MLVKRAAEPGARSAHSFSRTMTSGPNINLARTAFAVALFGVVLGGMLTGEAIGDTPILQKRGHKFAIPQTPAPEVSRTASRNTPDHYPLVTPEGTIPVAELAFHGRLRDQRLEWFDQGDTQRLDADYENFFDQAEVDALASGPAVTREPLEQGKPRDPSPIRRSTVAGAVIVEPLAGTLEVEPIADTPEPISIDNPENKKGDL